MNLQLPHKQIHISCTVLISSLSRSWGKEINVSVITVESHWLKTGVSAESGLLKFSLLLIATAQLKTSYPVWVLDHTSPHYQSQETYIPTW